MKEKKNFYANLTTPITEALFSRIVTADPMYKRFSITLKLDPSRAEHKNLITEIREAEKNAIAFLEERKEADNFKKLELKADLTKDGKPTGKLLLRTHSARIPAVVKVGAEGTVEPVMLQQEIAPGSLIKTKLTISSYPKGGVVKTPGITVYLNQIMLIKEKSMGETLTLSETELNEINNNPFN